MLRAAMSLNATMESTEALLMANFHRFVIPLRAPTGSVHFSAYDSNRAPFVLSLNADFLQMLENGAAVHALKSFITKVCLNGHFGRLFAV